MTVCTISSDIFSVSHVTSLKVTLPSATLTILEHDAPPSFSIDDVTHNEGNSGTTSYVFTVTKTGNTAVSASVDYETVDETAVAPSDYTAIAAYAQHGRRADQFLFSHRKNRLYR